MFNLGLGALYAGVCLFLCRSDNSGFGHDFIPAVYLALAIFYSGYEIVYAIRDRK